MSRVAASFLVFVSLVAAIVAVSLVASVAFLVGAFVVAAVVDAALHLAAPAVVVVVCSVGWVGSGPVVDFRLFLTTSFQTPSGALPDFTAAVAVMATRSYRGTPSTYARGPARPAEGSATFHQHQQLFFPAHYYVGKLCKVSSGVRHLQH